MKMAVVCGEALEPETSCDGPGSNASPTDIRACHEPEESS